MYPRDFRTFVEVGGLSDYLCGGFRPGHFRGVSTVVAKLLNIVRPQAAYFGQKDAQQAIIIKKMVADLNMPVIIKVLPTIRECDGLAMSSRNVYLSQEERAQARVIYKSLRLAKELIYKGNRNSGQIIQRMRQNIARQSSAKVQYISIADVQGLAEVEKIKGKVLIAIAAYLGKTRLIDNIVVDPKHK
jgi:pantoate--beta-alanine ligase